MALTMSVKRYQEIREKVMRRRLTAKVEKIVSEPGAMTFQTVDEFFNFLDRVEEAPESEPRQSRRKRR